MTVFALNVNVDVTLDGGPCITVMSTTFCTKNVMLIETSIVMPVPTVTGVNVNVYVPSLLSVTALKLPVLLPEAIDGVRLKPPMVCGLPFAL